MYAVILKWGSVMLEDKLLLAHLRGGDFTHPGSIEAINLTMDKFLKDPNQKILDIGCGLGGTAHIVQKQGWGSVVGIDIDEHAIQYAKENYPEISFYHCDVNNVSKLFSYHQYDIAYIFSAFYSFKSQQQSLEILANMTKENGKLVIFDYSSPSNFNEICPFLSGRNGKPFVPINIKNIRQLLYSTGWKLEETVDETDHFSGWYDSILSQLKQKETDLIAKFGQAAFNKIYHDFFNVFNMLQRKTLGGVIVYAEKI